MQSSCYVVCVKCISGDAILSDWVRDKGEAAVCSYCSQNTDPALPIADLAKLMLPHIETEYEFYVYKPCVPSEGTCLGSQFEYLKEFEDIGFNPGIEIHDALAEVLDYRSDPGGIPHGYQLIGDLSAALGELVSPKDTWKKRTEAPDGAQIFLGWMQFVEEIQHRRRFLFWLNKKSTDNSFPQTDRVEDLLEHIGNVLKNRFVPRLAGEIIYRARIAKNGENFSKREQLGAPKSEAATAGRMNPPGIPYFYAACDKLTACAEVCADTPDKINTVFVGSWKLKKDLLLVDLQTIGEVPSFFDKRVSHAKREELLFLRGFIDAISKPVHESDKAQLDYIPGQVMSEYLRMMLSDKTGRKVDGVLYSSIQNPGGTCIVIFPRGDDLGFQDNLFGRQITLLPDVEKIFVGAALDLILPKSSKKDASRPWEAWEISAHGGDRAR